VGRLTEALESYDRALAINPHMDSISQMVRELRASRAS